jgi:hypothetical protein
MSNSAASSLVAAGARTSRSMTRRRVGSAAALDFTGAMLGHHLHQSTTYFSRWIELKTQLAQLRAQSDVDNMR